MEVYAAIKALETLPGALVIHSDSSYLVNCMKRKYWRRWVRNGWINSNGDPVANPDLWRRLLAALGDRDVRWVKVPGHAKDTMNNRADALAVRAKKSPVADPGLPSLFGII